MQSRSEAERKRARERGCVGAGAECQREEVRGVKAQSQLEDGDGGHHGRLDAPLLALPACWLYIAASFVPGRTDGPLTGRSAAVVSRTRVIQLHPAPSTAVHDTLHFRCE